MKFSNLQALRAIDNLHRSKDLFLKHIFSHFQEVIERHEAVMGQLMSGEPKNQNIPGLDSILRGEILRKDGLIRYHPYITQTFLGEEGGHSS